MTNIKDLAKIARVSVTTVSRVLNNHPYVSEEKRMAVLKAIKDTNYNKNINAVHLSKGKTLMIGVVLPYSDHPYFSLLLKGIANEALKNNYKLVLFQTDYLEQREMEALEMLKQKQIDSVIICSRASDWKTIEEHLSFGKIVVCENMTERHVSSTYVDHYKTFLEALEFLFSKGYEKIGYCIGRKTGSNSLARECAYRDFMNKHNLSYTAEYIIDDCLYFEDGEKVMKKIRGMVEPPEALLVTSDQVAAGIVTYCHNNHIAIPDELAIIGFDNEPIAKLMNITTIHIPLEDMGKSLFLQAVSKERTNNEVMIKLIERGTA
ncbi:LacI family DNA-binding transcriptional regulator [Cytobacillus sp. FJAT-54145]|uniref:LacI family DNA-binding transcriptional regulator n=1 Tax=Cytobacillus spartinae TaxID=3299023 RepID=A0ABW6KB68_9BACI